MWVDADDLRAELERLERKGEEELAEENVRISTIMKC